MTQVHAIVYVDCPFSAALEFAEKAVRRRGDLYLTPAPPLGERVRFSAATADDTSDPARKHDALLIAWRPQNRGMFPDFRGVLTVRPKQRGTLLRLTGQYKPPYGLAGTVFDFFVGRMIARKTMHHLLTDLAVDMEVQYAKERQSYKSA